MTLKQTILAFMLGLSTAGAAQATTLNTSSAVGGGDGVLQDFSGIDWHANGAAWIRNFNLSNKVGATTDFDLYYQGFAGNINTSSALRNLRVAKPGNGIGTYELTAVAHLRETATCLAIGKFGCQSVLISTIANQGSWSVYFDTNKSTFANPILGTGYTNGTKILGGTWTEGTATFMTNSTGTFGTGGGFLTGHVDYTNSAFVDTDMLATNIQTSLQYPGQALFTRPAKFDGVGATGANSATSFVMQADASQEFTPVPTIPEPATLSLLGAAMVGMTVVVRRRRQR